MQYRIVVRLGLAHKGFVRDNRGRAPSYAAFDVTSADRCTVAPDLATAKRVKSAFVEYCEKYGPSGLGYVPTRISLEIHPEHAQVDR